MNGNTFVGVLVGIGLMLIVNHFVMDIPGGKNA